MINRTARDTRPCCAGCSDTGAMKAARDGGLQQRWVGLGGGWVGGVRGAWWDHTWLTPPRTWQCADGEGNQEDTLGQWLRELLLFVKPDSQEGGTQLSSMVRGALSCLYLLMA
jgi:hypothetical protein